MDLPLLFSIVAYAIPLYIVFNGVKRFFFHRLASFPGPPLAALTLWYKAFFDIVMDGGWAEHLDSLHATYGPIVRVAPNELHFSDPKAYADIYGMGSKFTKDPHLYSCFATETSVFVMTDPHEATQRRNLLGPLFSRKAVLKLEGVIQTQIENLIYSLLKYQSTGKAADLDLAFRATSLDITTDYCFNLNGGFAKSKDFQSDMLLAVDVTVPVIWLFRYIPLVKHLLLNVPDWMTQFLRPGAAGVLKQLRQMGTQIDGLLKDPEGLNNLEHDTMYHQFFASNDTKPVEYQRASEVLSRTLLLDEATYLRFAGSDTVGNVCTVGAYYILTNPSVHSRLAEELCEAWPDVSSPMGFEILEKLPFLTAVIKESLRMAHGVVTPLPRVVGPDDTDISGISIPAGTVVSIGATLVHRNPEIFIDPFAFLPERWLQKDSQELEKYLVSFSKGPRSCLGINLAWCELYLMFGNVFRRLALEAQDPSLENVSFREYFAPIRRGKHLQARVQARDSGC